MDLLKALAVLALLFLGIMLLMGVPQAMWRNYQTKKKAAKEQEAANNQEAA